MTDYEAVGGGGEWHPAPLGGIVKPTHWLPLPLPPDRGANTRKES